MAGKNIEILIKQIAKLPSLGARSARRIVLHLLNKREASLRPLIESLQNVADNIKTCEICGNFDTVSPCPICSSTNRDESVVCVVRDVADLWAMERVALFKGKYHVLGGVLSAMEGIVPEDLNIDALERRVKSGIIKELILALPATIDGQITSHYLLSKFKDCDLKITTLAQGIPMGAELDYMDEGTIQLALSSRKILEINFILHCRLDDLNLPSRIHDNLQNSLLFDHFSPLSSFLFSVELIFQIALLRNLCRFPFLLCSETESFL